MLSCYVLILTHALDPQSIIWTLHESHCLFTKWSKYLKSWVSIIKFYHYNNNDNNAKRRTGIARSRVQTPLKSWLFQASDIRNCLNCVHNWDDHSLLNNNNDKIIIIITKQWTAFTKTIIPQGMFRRTKEKGCKSRCEQEWSYSCKYLESGLLCLQQAHRKCGMLHFYYYYQSQEGVSKEYTIFNAVIKVCLLIFTMNWWFLQRSPSHDLWFFLNP